MTDQYDHLNREQLLQLVRQRERQKKLGLVWERNEIERDRAIDDHFIALTLASELCDGAAPWPNLVIEGDNFDALRWLRMTLRGQVKCILIDPPYNTGNKDWVYNDHYIDKEDAWRHSTWLEFLYQRLAIARDLLASDGVLLVTINDENRARLDMLLEEVLPGMRLGSLVWRTKDTGNDAGRRLSQVHEHILVYGRESFRFNGRPVSLSKFRNPDNDPRGDWQPQPLNKSHTYTERGQAYYPIFDHDTGYWYPCDPNSVWRYSSESRLKPGQKIRSETIEDLQKKKKIYFPPFDKKDSFFYHTKEELLTAIQLGKVPKLPKKGTPLLREDLPDLDFWVGKPIAPGRPSRKDFLEDKPLEDRIAPLGSWIAGLNEDIDEQTDEEVEIVRSPRGGAGGDELVEIMGKKVFDNPKPVALIRELVRQSTGPDSIVLDFFAGSATTAQAVMELNAADGGSRRFIMVSSTEASEDAPDRNICRDVTAERVRRLNRSEDAAFAALKAPFAYLRTREINFEDLDFELSVEEAWAALETFHGLPLTGWDPGASFAEHPGDDGVLLLVDRLTEAALAAIRAHVAAGTTLYLHAFAPGQLRTALEGLDVEVTGVRDALVKRFVA